MASCNLILLDKYLWIFPFTCSMKLNILLNVIIECIIIHMWKHFNKTCLDFYGVFWRPHSCYTSWYLNLKRDVPCHLLLYKSTYSLLMSHCHLVRKLQLIKNYKYVYILWILVATLSILGFAMTKFNLSDIEDLS